MKSLDGMSILITGGGSGIGFGTARHCVERGARVTICGTSTRQNRSRRR